jgi:hypothetical protein
VTFVTIWEFPLTNHDLVPSLNSDRTENFRKKSKYKVCLLFLFRMVRGTSLIDRMQLPLYLGPSSPSLPRPFPLPKASDRLTNA